MALKIEELEDEIPVYDISVGDTHCFIGNNIVVHNCLEITLPTKPLDDINSETGEISTCILSAINWGLIRQPSDFERVTRLAVRGLDSIIDYQSYPVLAAELSTKNRRPIGVGIINFAYWLAKHDLKYNEDALPLVDEYAEAWSFYLIKASADLAVEKGACPYVYETKYSDGIVPIDTRKIEVDQLVPHKERLPWNDLRLQLKRTGIRNSTVMAIMPAECQSWDNKLSLADGRELNFHEFLTDLGIDWNKIEKSAIPQRYAFDKPILVNTQNGPKPAYEYYYNGYAELIELTFDDGKTYKFTTNHKLLVIRDNKEQWIEVGDLFEGDEIVSI